MGRRRKMLTAVALFLAIALPIGYWFFNPPKPKSTAVPAAPPTSAPGLPEKRIAVLAFKPLMAETRDPVLELGMAGTLIAKLGIAAKSS